MSWLQEIHSVILVYMYMYVHWFNGFSMDSFNGLIQWFITEKFNGQKLLHPRINWSQSKCLYKLCWLTNRFIVTTCAIETTANSVVWLQRTDLLYIVTKDDITKAIQSRIPKKTLQTTKWAYGIWNSWCKVRNISDELTQMTASRMDELLAQFIMEAKRQDSEV